jgi:CPA2 family monovalent cation:H+ antiporter-2
MTDLALTLLLALAAAVVLGAVALRLGLPPMLGYIGAGVVVGPVNPAFEVDQEQVLALADIGVAFLMFSIGLQFSIGELRSVGARILAGTPVQVAITMALGAGIGLLLGWELTEALFIGAAVAVCSTVVLVRVAGEEVLHTTAHGRTALGVSIVQDLVTVVLVVALSTVGRAEDLTLGGAGREVLVALAFIAVVLAAGSRIFPRLLAFVARFRSRELFIISIALLAIGTAFAAESLGVSIALGAFVAGLAVSEPELTAGVLGEIVPLRELFATFFFVSIGILLQPAAIAAALPVVLTLLLVITLGKALPVAGLALLDGQRPSSAARAGALIGQSGEFSFVIASTGLGLGAIDSDTFTLAMGAVVISIVTAYPLLQAANRLGRGLDRAVVHPPLPGSVPELRRHAVIVGFGRVGRSVARVFSQRGFSWIAIDGDYGIVRHARQQGSPVIYGDAGSPSVLDQARVGTCHTVILAIPDALASRQAALHVRAVNPRAEIVARAHSEAEEVELRRMGVARVVVAERELGNELLRHALRRFGVGDREITAMLQRRREP